VQAVFAKQEQILRIRETLGQGQVDPEEGDHFYFYGDVVTVTISPDPAWVFFTWRGPDKGDMVDHGAGTWSVWMDADKVVQAEFREALYQVSLAYEGQGYVQNEPGNPYAYGQVATLAPVPLEGWRFGGWQGEDVTDLVDNGDGTWSLTVDEDKSLTATFLPPQIFLPLVHRSP
jgi:hypothetical protein